MVTLEHLKEFAASENYHFMADRATYDFLCKHFRRAGWEFDSWFRNDNSLCLYVAMDKEVHGSGISRDMVLTDISHLLVPKVNLKDIYDAPTGR